MTVRILTGDCRERLAELPAGSARCCVTSPPYFGLRDYGVAGQIGAEQTPDEYLAALVDVFRAVRRVLADDGTLWLNLGDSYAAQGGPQVAQSKWQVTGASDGQNGGKSRRPTDGIKPKDLLMIPARAAIALQADGWYLRSHIIWHKPNPMPESVRDRPTSSHESVFLLAKSERYHFDADAIKEPSTVPGWDDGTRVYGGVNKAGANAQHGNRTSGRRAERRRDVPPRHAGYVSSDQSGLDEVGRGEGRNSRNVWTIASQPYSGAHCAVMPPDLAERCILAGSAAGDTVLDPFFGAGTTGLVADRLGRHCVGVELNPSSVAEGRQRIERDAGMFASVAAE